jgi:hypothetical protein
MIGNLEPEENVLPKTFKQTSDKLYDRHDYKIVYENGLNKIFDNYHDLFLEWCNTKNRGFLHIEVLDKKTKKDKNKKGFS